MKSKLTLLVGAISIGLPIAAPAQVTPPTEEPAQPPATQETEQPATPTPSQEPAQQSESQSPASEVKAATAAEIKTGATVNDQKGGEVGKVESVDAEGVVVSTGTVRAKIPASSFGISEKGLVISMTRAELEAAAKKEKK